MKQKQFPKYLKSNLVTQELDGELLIYNLAENKAFCLNPTASAIWLLSNGYNSISKIVQELEIQFNSPITEEFVWLALDQMKKENLIENDVELPQNFTKLSRRQVIKNVGLNTFAALPVISSLFVPTAAHAGSACRTNSVSCTSSTQCCSTNTTNIENPRNTVIATFTGSCCRNGDGPYGANNTCIPGVNGNVIPAGYVTYNGVTRTSSGTINCHP